MINQKIDKRISFSIIFMYITLLANYSLKQFLNINNDYQRELVSLFFYIIILFVYLINFKYVLKRISNLILFIMIAFLVIMLFNYILYPDNFKYIDIVSIVFSVFSFFSFIFYTSLKNKDTFFILFIQSVYIQSFFSILYFLSIDFNNTIFYSMSYSYYILPLLLLLIWKMFKSFKIIDLFLFLLNLVFLISVGSRGPLVVVMIFLIILFVNKIIKFRNKSQFLISMSLVTLLFLLIININNIIIYLTNILSNRGITSRTISTILDPSSVFLSGRDTVYSYTLDYINKRPILGYGVWGDRKVLSSIDQAYPHNIFLEILMQYGIIIGSLILITLLGLIFYRFLKGSNNKEKYFFAFSLGFLPLLVSGSYLTSYDFWLFLAIFINYNVENRKIK